MPNEGLEQVALEPKNMPLVQRALEVIELFTADAAKRKAIALRWGNLQDAGLITVLEKAHGQGNRAGGQSRPARNHL